MLVMAQTSQIRETSGTALRQNESNIITLSQLFLSFSANHNQVEICCHTKLPRHCYRSAIRQHEQ